MTTPAVGDRPPQFQGALARRWLEPALIVAFWTVMGALTAASQALDPRAPALTAVVPAASLALAFINAYLWAALTPLIFRLSRRYPIERATWRTRLPALLGVGIVMAGVVDVVVAYLRFEVFFTGPWSRTAFDPLFGFKRLFWLNNLVVYLAVLAAGFARDAFFRLRARQADAVRLQADATRLEAEAAHLEAQLAEARLAALRAQLDPHFLFNTLNAVSSLVERDPRGARRMIAHLSALLRHTLEQAVEPEMPLAQEVDVLARYVEIMAIRFEARLEVDTRIDPGALDALVPTLILQPLVENAIKHGVGRLPHATVGRVEVTARRADDLVVLTVRDNGPVLGDAARLTRSGGVGLRNTRARLAQLYGSEHSFTLMPAPEGGVVAELRLPYHTRGDLQATALDAVPVRGTSLAAVAIGSV